MGEMKKGHWTRAYTKLGKEVLFWISDQESRENVQITDILYDGLVPRVESDEYVEITNRGNAPQDLTGWLFKDITKGFPSFIFTFFFFFDRATIVFYTNEIHPEWGGFSFHSRRAIWNNKVPDTAALYNAKGQEVSRRSYVPSFKHAKHPL